MLGGWRTQPGCSQPPTTEKTAMRHPFERPETNRHPSRCGSYAGLCVSFALVALASTANAQGAPEFGWAVEHEGQAYMVLGVVDEGTPAHATLTGAAAELPCFRSVLDDVQAECPSVMQAPMGLPGYRPRFGQATVTTADGSMCTGDLGRMSAIQGLSNNFEEFTIVLPVAGCTSARAHVGYYGGDQGLTYLPAPERTMELFDPDALHVIAPPQYLPEWEQELISEEPLLGAMTEFAQAGEGLRRYLWRGSFEAEGGFVYETLYTLVWSRDAPVEDLVCEGVSATRRRVEYVVDGTPVSFEPRFTLTGIMTQDGSAAYFIAERYCRAFVWSATAEPELIAEFGACYGLVEEDISMDPADPLPVCPHG